MPPLVWKQFTGIQISKIDAVAHPFTFNPDVLENQIGLWISRKLEDQGLDHMTCMSHTWRFFEVRTFLGDHEDRLKTEGLIVEDPVSKQGALISESLISILATSPYEGVRAQGPDRDPVRTFHLDKIIEATFRLEKESP